MKPQLILCALLISCQAKIDKDASSSDSQNIKTKASLIYLDSFKPSAQKTETWCWAATTEVLLDGFGIRSSSNQKIDQCEIVERKAKAKSETKCCYPGSVTSCPEGSCNYNIAKCLITGDIVTHLFGLSCNNHNGALTFLDVKGELQNGRPLGISVNDRFGVYDAKHLFVINGLFQSKEYFSNKNDLLLLFLVDSAPKGLGDFMIIEYDAYRRFDSYFKTLNTKYNFHISDSKHCTSRNLSQTNRDLKNVQGAKNSRTAANFWLNVLKDNVTKSNDKVFQIMDLEKLLECQPFENNDPRIIKTLFQMDGSSKESKIYVISGSKEPMIGICIAKDKYARYGKKYRLLSIGHKKRIIRFNDCIKNVENKNHQFHYETTVLLQDQPSGMELVRFTTNDGKHHYSPLFDYPRFDLKADTLYDYLKISNKTN